jgi:hypothetical protein
VSAPIRLALARGFKPGVRRKERRSTRHRGRQKQEGHAARGVVEDLVTARRSGARFDSLHAVLAGQRLHHDRQADDEQQRAPDARRAAGEDAGQGAGEREHDDAEQQFTGHGDPGMGGADRGERALVVAERAKPGLQGSAGRPREGVRQTGRRRRAA